jgi:hypothetical protein
MIIRFGAVVLFAGLSFASPSSAENLLQESSFSLDLREGETQALDAVTNAMADPAPVLDAMIGQVPAIDPPGPLAGLALPEGQVEASQTSNTLDDLALTSDPAVQTSSTAALSDRDGSEDFAWMTAEGSLIGEITTGSIATTAEPAEAAPQFLSNPLTDDAFTAE